MKIEIVFENKNNEKFSLFWETTENPITFLWLKKILKIFKSDFDVKTRWSGFQFEDRKNEYLLKRLKNCVDIINACEYIDFKMPKLEVNEYSVDLHNQYHHYFEILMGKTWQYSKYIEEAKKTK